MLLDHGPPVGKLRCVESNLKPQTSNLKPQTADDPFVYYYFKDKKVLAPDATQIAVQNDAQFAGKALSQDETVRAAQGDLATLHADKVFRHAGGTWTLVEEESDKVNGRINALGERAAIEERVATAVKTTQARFVSPVFRGSDGSIMLIASQIVIGFTREASEAQTRTVLENIPGKVSWQKLGKKQRYLVQTSHRSALDLLAVANSLIANNDVLYAHPDFLVRAQASYTPTDPLYPQSWHLNNTGQNGGLVGFDLGVSTAWDTTRGNASVVVAVLDSGVDVSHPDLSGKIVDARNFAFGDPLQYNGVVTPVGNYENHGTSVAGCVSAGMNNGVGTTAPAPDVRLAIARIGFNYNSGGGFDSYTSSWINAIYWADQIGASITNNSNVFTDPNFYNAGIAQAYADTRGGVNTTTQTSSYSGVRPKGIVHFVSAGNNYTAPLGFIAKLPSVNAVGAMDRFGNLASYSQTGPELRFVAPGVEIVSTDRQGSLGYNGISGYSDYAMFGGTSAASPLAAGVAALVASRYPDWTAQQIENQLRRTAKRNLGALASQSSWPNSQFGYGLVRADDALALGNWQLFNVSNRAFSSGSDITFMGFVVDGTANKKVLVRAVGPELTAQGVSGAMSNPKLTLFNSSGGVVDFNDDWNSSNATALRAAAETVGAFALSEGSASAAIVRDMAPGVYTVQIQGSGGSSGVALGEVYDADASYTTKFVNLSTRTEVRTGDGILIQGLVIQGNSPRRVLLRGIGPTLADFGVTGALANPQMVVFSGSTAIASNDDWGNNGNVTEIVSVSSQVGAFALPSGSLDSALLLWLDPGLYTIHISGVGGGTGNAMAEVYLVNP